MTETVLVAALSSAPLATVLVALIVAITVLWITRPMWRIEPARPPVPPAPPARMIEH